MQGSCEAAGVRPDKNHEARRPVAVPAGEV